MEAKSIHLYRNSKQQIVALLSINIDILFNIEFKTEIKF